MYMLQITLWRDSFLFTDSMEWLGWKGSQSLFSSNFPAMGRVANHGPRWLLYSPSELINFRNIWKLCVFSNLVTWTQSGWDGVYFLPVSSFGSVTRTMLIAHGCCGCCWAVLAWIESFLPFHCTPPASRLRLGWGWEETQLGQITKEIFHAT